MAETENDNTPIEVSVEFVQPDEAEQLHRLIKRILQDPHEQDLPLYPSHLDVILRKKDYAGFLVFILADLGYLNLSEKWVITMTPEQLKMEYKNDLR